MSTQLAYTRCGLNPLMHFFSSMYVCVRMCVVFTHKRFNIVYFVSTWCYNGLSRLEKVSCLSKNVSKLFIAAFLELWPRCFCYVRWWPVSVRCWQRYCYYNCYNLITLSSLFFIYDAIWSKSGLLDIFPLTDFNAKLTCLMQLYKVCGRQPDHIA